MTSRIPTPRSSSRRSSSTDAAALTDEYILSLLEEDTRAWAGAAQPRPPLGLVPTEQSVAAVEVGAYSMNGKLRRYGLDLCGITYAETFLVDGETKFGAPLGPPVDGVMRARELIGLAAAREIDPSFTDAWLGGGPRAVVLTDTVLSVPIGSMLNDGALIVGRGRLQYYLRLEHGTKYRVMDAVMLDGALSPLNEPVTWADAQAALVAHASSTFSDKSDEQELLANELRLQCVPERCKNFARCAAALPPPLHPTSAPPPYLRPSTLCRALPTHNRQ